MKKIAYIENEDFKVPGNWERFLKHFQEKFWKELNPISGQDSNKENELLIKVKN